MTPNPDLSSIDFSSKTALITGTTNGLGRSLCFSLVRLNLSTLIMGVRNIPLAESLKQELLAINPRVNILILKLDLASFKSVIKFSDEVNKAVEKLDVAVLNAGVGGYNFKKTEDGHEEILQINVYSTALLALELLPLLEVTARAKGTPSRLTWIGSFVQMNHNLQKKPLSPTKSIISQLDDETRFDKTRYQDSKLLSTMLVKELAPKIDSNLVVLNEVSPGPVLTNFGATYPAYFRAALAVAGWFINKDKSLKAGTDRCLHAMAGVGEESHGWYISDFKKTGRATFVETEAGRELAVSFFKEVMNLCHEEDPRLAVL